MKRTYYYGWNITWAFAITQMVGYGILFYAFSVFIKPMEAELAWTRAQTSGAFSLMLLISGLVAIPIGRWVDKRGARALMTIGSSLGFLLLLGWSFTTNLVVFYVVQAGLGLVMAATLYEVAFTVVAVWFRRNRKTSMLIITLMGGLASTIFIPLASFLVDVLYWRDALRVLAGILALTAIPLHAFVIRKNPKELGLEPDGRIEPQHAPEKSLSPREALQESSFWWISSAFTLDRITVIAVAAHSVPMLLEQGYAAATVAAALGAIGIMQFAGRLFFTPSTAKFSLASLAAVTFLCHSFGLVSLLLIPNLTGIWLFTGFHGIANGAGTLARAALVADTYGPAHYGSINGSMVTMIAIVQTIAPLGAGALRDLTGNYTLVLWLLVALSGLAAFAVLQARPKPVSPALNAK